MANEAKQMHRRRDWTFEVEETSSGMMYSVYDPNGNRLTEPYISEGFARLIAAAPDMFEALKIARASIVSGFDTVEAIAAIDAALSRASD